MFSAFSQMKSKYGSDKEITKSQISMEIDNMRENLEIAEKFQLYFDKIPQIHRELIIEELNK